MSALLGNTLFLGSIAGAGARAIWLGETGQLDVTPGTDFTVLLAVRLQGDATRTVFSNSGGGNEGWTILVDSGPLTAAAVTFTVGDSVGSPISVVGGRVPAAQNGVHLIACEYEAGVEIRIYIDDVLQATTSLPGNYIASAGVVTLGGGQAECKHSEAGFTEGLISETSLGNLFSDFLRTGMLRPGVVLNPESIPVTLPDIDSVYSVQRNQRVQPVQAFPSVGTGPAVTLNAAVAGTPARNTYSYDAVPHII